MNTGVDAQAHDHRGDQAGDHVEVTEHHLRGRQRPGDPARKRHQQGQHCPPRAKQHEQDHDHANQRRRAAAQHVTADDVPLGALVDVGADEVEAQVGAGPRPSAGEDLADAGAHALDDLGGEVEVGRAVDRAQEHDQRVDPLPLVVVARPRASAQPLALLVDEALEGRRRVGVWIFDAHIRGRRTKLVVAPGGDALAELVHLGVFEVVERVLDKKLPAQAMVDAVEQGVVGELLSQGVGKGVAGVLAAAAHDDVDRTSRPKVGFDLFEGRDHRVARGQQGPQIAVDLQPRGDQHRDQREHGPGDEHGIAMAEHLLDPPVAQPRGPSWRPLVRGRTHRLSTPSPARGIPQQCGESLGGQRRVTERRWCFLGVASAS